MKWKQDRETGKLTEIVAKPRRKSALIGGSFDPFVSPVDGSTIRDHHQLEQHNKRNNVTLDDFSSEQASRLASQQNLFGGRFKDKERHADIVDAIERCRGEGDNRYKY